MYVHLGPFSRFVIDKIDGQIRALDDGAWTTPALVAPPENAKMLSSTERTWSVFSDGSMASSCGSTNVSVCVEMGLCR